MKNNPRSEMIRRLRRQLMLSFTLAALTITTPLAPAASKEKVVTTHVANLPAWTGETHTLKWLNPRLFRSSADGRAPDARFGLERFPMVLHARALPVVARPGRPIPLVGGWEVEASLTRDCLKGQLLLRHRATGQRASWSTRYSPATAPSDNGSICATSQVAAQHAVVLNSRHVAFLTNESSWIFFDRQQARFLPLVVITNPERHSDLYVTPEGQVLVDVDLSYDPATRSATADPRANGIRAIIYHGKPLKAAPLRSEDIDEVRGLNRMVQCWIATDNGEACEAP